MSRTIPAALQAHLDQPATTTCRLLRIALRDGRVFGVTSLDADVSYNDGRGLLTYSANQGVDPSTLAADSAMTVANAEAQSLLVASGHGITEAMIEAGDLRDAEWTLYLVNYRDLGQGHVILGAGDIGEVTKRWGLVWMPELLSYSVRLRQPVGTHWSRTCRAIFGSDAQGQTGCGVNLAPLWSSGSVTAVGAENDRQFTGSVVAGTLVPGRVEWLTGPNAGRLGVVEAFEAGAVTLANAMPYPIAAGHTYRIRPDCARTWAACVAYGNQANFRGEPLIPTGDAAAVSTPGAQVPSPSILTQIANAATGQGPEQPQPDVPLVNSGLTAAGGWVVRRQNASPGFSQHPTVPGFSYDSVATGPKAQGVLRWQATGALPVNGFDFGDFIDNIAVAPTRGGEVAVEGWVRCTAITGATATDYAFVRAGIQIFEDEACTIPVGGTAAISSGAELQFREVGPWRLITARLANVPAGRFCRLTVSPMTSVPVTLEFDTFDWSLDAAAWATRGQR